MAISSQYRHARYGRAVYGALTAQHNAPNGPSVRLSTRYSHCVYGLAKYSGLNALQTQGGSTGKVLRAPYSRIRYGRTAYGGTGRLVPLTSAIIDDQAGGVPQDVVLGWFGRIAGYIQEDGSELGPPQDLVSADFNALISINESGGGIPEDVIGISLQTSQNTSQPPGNSTSHLGGSGGWSGKPTPRRKSLKNLSSRMVDNALYDKANKKSIAEATKKILAEMEED